MLGDRGFVLIVSLIGWGIKLVTALSTAISRLRLRAEKWLRGIKIYTAIEGKQRWLVDSSAQCCRGRKQNKQTLTSLLPFSFQELRHKFPGSSTIATTRARAESSTKYASPNQKWQTLKSLVNDAVPHSSGWFLVQIGFSNCDTWNLWCPSLPKD